MVSSEGVQDTGDAIGVEQLSLKENDCTSSDTPTGEGDSHSVQDGEDEGVADSSRFCIRRVVSVLGKCNESCDVQLGYYLEALRELIKFIKSMGYAFGFAASDVHKKVSLLESLRVGKNGEHYTTVAGMIQYESGDEAANKEMTGCLTLLILHRSLAFIMGLLRVIGDVKDDSVGDSPTSTTAEVGEIACAPEESMCRVARVIYASTMGKYHSWVVKKAAALAILTLGTRTQMFNQVVENVEQEEGYRLIADCVHRLGAVYQRVEQLYESPSLAKLK